MSPSRCHTPQSEFSQRRLPVGAEVQPQGGVHFRVWAPKHRRVEAVLDSSRPNNGVAAELALEDNGYFSGLVPEADVGDRYWYRLDGEATLFPDPVSRFQPDGPSGPSQVVDPLAFRWTDAGWPGPRLEGQVIYEMHVGTFTPGGTWAAAVEELDELASVGITMLEVMPISEFPGRFGWGYDGVGFFAPAHLYGEPDGFRRFVDRAHAVGIAVILDVVYNHVGPCGNRLTAFSEDYFSRRHKTDWGPAINFDGEHSAPVREFVLANAAYWIREFHLDGLRLDATQNIYDDSPEHILAAITRSVRDAAGGRSIVVVAENEPQHAWLTRPADQGGYRIDALWNDDFHHTAMVAMTGRREAYYMDYLGSPQEFVAAAKRGFLFQGQWYKWQKKPRGTPTHGMKPAAFVTFIQNHDQIANAAYGLRIHQLTSPGLYRAMTALMLLGPGTPMLFQGQEFAASSPFLYFADLDDDNLASQVRLGRQEFLGQFPSIATPEVQALLADPSDPATFQRSKLDLSERRKHAKVYAMHRDLLQLRREDRAFRAQRSGGVDGAVLSNEAFVLRFFVDGENDRLLVVNLGRDTALDPAPEPLLAPPPGKTWRILWSSEDPRYGGGGTGAVYSLSEQNWQIPGQAAVVLKPVELAQTGDSVHK